MKFSTRTSEWVCVHTRTKLESWAEKWENKEGGRGYSSSLSAMRKAGDWGKKVIFAADVDKCVDFVFQLKWLKWANVCVCLPLCRTLSGPLFLFLLLHLSVSFICPSKCFSWQKVGPPFQCHLNFTQQLLLFQLPSWCKLISQVL